MAEQFYGTGRRKSSVARVRLVPGNGNITINDFSVMHDVMLVSFQRLEGSVDYPLWNSN